MQEEVLIENLWFWWATEWNLRKICLDLLTGNDELIFCNKTEVMIY